MSTPTSGETLKDRLLNFLDDLGSMSDESIVEADPALLGSYRDDAARLRDALLTASAPEVSDAQLREALEQLIAKWRAFATRTRAAEARLPAGIGMDDTKARMRGLTDQTEECADEIAALLAPPVTGEDRS